MTFAPIRFRDTYNCTYSGKGTIGIEVPNKNPTMVSDESVIVLNFKKLKWSYLLP
jgi:hypothetical protein